MEKAYIAIVLDKSGSMGMAKQQTISGFNEQVQAIKDGLDPNVETLVSLITFNGEVDAKFLNQSASSLQELTDADYIPRGATALFDAIGFAIDTLESSEDAELDTTSNLVIIMSDGEENSSSLYDGNKLASKIKELEMTDQWTFTYMGAVDAASIASKLNINIGNVASFDASNAKGYGDAFSTQVASTAMYMSARSQGIRSVSNFYDDGSDASKEDA